MERRWMRTRKDGELDLPFIPAGIEVQRSGLRFSAQGPSFAIWTTTRAKVSTRKAQRGGKLEEHRG
jgi:hypothetical protein